MASHRSGYICMLIREAHNNKLFGNFRHIILVENSKKVKREAHPLQATINFKFLFLEEFAILSGTREMIENNMTYCPKPLVLGHSKAFVLSEDPFLR